MKISRTIGYLLLVVGACMLVSGILLAFFFRTVAVTVCILGSIFINTLAITLLRQEKKGRRR